MPTCKSCQNPFPCKAIIDGVKRHLANRQYCLTCSPFGSHNTRRIHVHPDDARACSDCGKPYHKDRSKGHCGSRCNSCVQTNRRRSLKEEMVALKGGACQKCGYSRDIAALHFHHRDPSQKSYSIKHVMGLSRPTMLAELEKCDLLCANCHTEAHSAMA